MKYWIAKARPDDAGVDFLHAGAKTKWRTVRLPLEFRSGDRLFFWSTAPHLEIIGLGRVANPIQRARQGNLSYFHVLFLTDRLNVTVSINELRKYSVLQSASFLKSGPSGLLFPITFEQGEFLHTLIERKNLLPASAEWVTSDTAEEKQYPYASVEGKRKLVKHVRRERDRRLASYKKASAQASGRPLTCEACLVSLKTLDAELGEASCEVHHAKPIGRMARPSETTLDDLHILCANCHRMIHRAEPFLTVEELRRRLRRNNMRNDV